MTKIYVAIIAAFLTLAAVGGIAYGVYAAAHPWKPSAQNCADPQSENADQFTACTHWKFQQLGM